MLKKPENSEIVEIVFRLLENVASEERNVSKTHQETVTHTFHSFKHDFFVNIEWIDPKNVLGRNYGVPMIEFLSEKFKGSLVNKGFDATKSLTDFKQFRFFVKAT